MVHAIDEVKLGEFMGRMVGHMTGGAMCFGRVRGSDAGMTNISHSG